MPRTDELLARIEQLQTKSDRLSERLDRLLERLDRLDGGGRQRDPRSDSPGLPTALSNLPIPK